MHRYLSSSSDGPALRLKFLHHRRFIVKIVNFFTFELVSFTFVRDTQTHDPRRGHLGTNTFNLAKTDEFSVSFFVSKNADYLSIMLKLCPVNHHMSTALGRSFTRLHVRQTRRLIIKIRYIIISPIYVVQGDLHVGHFLVL